MDEEQKKPFRAMSVTYWASKAERDAVMQALDRHGLTWNAFSKFAVAAALKRLDRLVVKHQEGTDG
jgi:hypothetical protein